MRWQKWPSSLSRGWHLIPCTFETASRQFATLLNIYILSRVNVNHVCVISGTCENKKSGGNELTRRRISRSWGQGAADDLWWWKVPKTLIDPTQLTLSYTPARFLWEAYSTFLGLRFNSAVTNLLATFRHAE